MERTKMLKQKPNHVDKQQWFFSLSMDSATTSNYSSMVPNNCSNVMMKKIRFWQKSDK